MNATTTNKVRLASTQYEIDQKAPTDSIRVAQNSLLTELPGIAFALITLLYVASSLLTLA